MGEGFRGETVDPSAAALEAYVDYIDEVEAGKPVEFVHFCARHPDLAEELRRVHADWNLVEDVLDDLRAVRADPEAAARPVLPEAGSRDGPRYHRRGVVARGGMGTVYRVWDAELGRVLAMKVLQRPVVPAAEEGASPQALARFLEEAQVAAQLDHPGIAPVHDVGVDEDGRVYFTMKLVDGTTLRPILERVQSGDAAWTLHRVLGIVLKVCDAVAFAHSKGVIHRDLKPSNVMVGRFGEVYVMDWGLAKVLPQAGGEAPDDDVVEPQPIPRSVRASGSAGVTRVGEVIGTPGYMAPEQAASRNGDVGPASDVYAIGALLYHLLTGCAPHSDAAAGARPLLDRVRDEAPTPVDELAPDTPSELSSICAQAMRRDPDERYPNMTELADDLRAYLEGRVVRAFRTGPVAQLSKWIARNRLLVGATLAVGVTLALGIASTAWIQARKAAVETILHRLAASKQLEDLERRAGDLWPPHPDRIVEYRAWIDAAEHLVTELSSRDGVAGLREQLEDLRARALPSSEAEREAERRVHPDWWTLQDTERQRAALARAVGVRRGFEPPRPEQLGPEELSDEPGDLVARAWPLAHPVRMEFGHEEEGWALALRAVDLARDDRERAEALHILAWATYALGLDALAVRASAEAYELGPRDKKYREQLRRLFRTFLRPRRRLERLAQLDADLAELHAAVDERRTWRFADPDEQTLHDQVAALVAGLERFADIEEGLLDGTSPQHGWGVRRRLAFALDLEESSVTSPEARRRWAEASAAIADRERCPWYASLELAPQMGLLPLGPDPESGLWEFAHLASGEVATREADGRLTIEEGTGIVLVLVPGGSYVRGAQALDPTAAHHDPEASGDEGPVHRVQLEPFLLSKYELTQFQWYLLAADWPSRYGSGYRSGSHSVGLDHPVEEVSWEDARRVLARFDLELPTEARWEYAACTEGEGPWAEVAERGSLARTANLLDVSGRELAPPGVDSCEGWDDGYSLHAPVGSFAANAFGLHDMVGNVREWCLDAYQEGYRRWAPGSNEPSVDPEESRWRALLFRRCRGGSYASTALGARTTRRDQESPDYRSPDLGIRPARALR